MIKPVYHQLSNQHHDVVFLEVCAAALVYSSSRLQLTLGFLCTG